ncbi:AMP-binding protein [Microbulbifer agarilyticus]
MSQTNYKSVADLIEKSLQTYKDKPAYSCLGQTLTFGEIDEKSRALASWLQKCSGLTVGDRVAIQLPNLVQYPIAAYAVLRAGMVLVNTNPLYTPSEMRHQFKDSGAKAVIILADLMPKLDVILSETDIECTIVTGAGDLLAGKTALERDDVNGFLQVIEEGAELSLDARQGIDLDEVCVLQYTGGTTGVSKGAMLTHGNLLGNAAQVVERLGGRCGEASEIFVCPLPLYHIYAFMVNMVVFASRGNLNVLIPNPRDIEAFVSAIAPFRFTGFSGINTLFVGLCQVEAFKQLDFSGLHLTISGGSTLTLAAAEAWRSVTGCTVSEGYGLSETSPVLCLNDPGAELLGSVGRPLANTEIQLLGASGEPVKDGEEGEVVVRGAQVMKGYWQRPDETEKVLTSNGFFKTGDVGVRLPSGHIKIVDRLKDMIIVSGFNVFPNEVEEVLTSHPAVIEAAVVGEPDDKSGERVCAYITVSEEVSEDAIRSHCREKLTAYKIPKVVRILDELPKSTVGKILRRMLRS